MTEVSSEEQVPAVEEQVEAPQPAPTTLTVEDLLLVTQIIQVAADRGAIKPEEMTNVGKVYTKLLAFLEASGAIKANQQQAPATEETTQ
jgi:hypothetical protein